MPRDEGELEVLAPLGEGGTDPTGRGAEPGTDPTGRGAEPGTGSGAAAASSGTGSGAAASSGTGSGAAGEPGAGSGAAGEPGSVRTVGRWMGGVPGRWLVVTVALALTAILVAWPGRTWLARRELGWLQRQWRQSMADDSGRMLDAQILADYFLVDEHHQVAPALASLYQQEQADLATLSGRLRRAILVDPGLSTLRDEMVAALRTRSSLLAHAIAQTRGLSPRDSESFIEAGSGDALLPVISGLAREETHWHVRSTPALPPTHFPSVDDTVRKLSKWVDEPTGTVLLAANQVATTLIRLDIDLSRVSATSIPETASPTPRAGYLAYVTNNAVYAAAPDGSGTPRRLADAMFILPAADRTAIWVVNEDATVREVDGAGRILAGPVRPPGSPQAATSGGLIITTTSPLRLVRWDASTGRLGCAFDDPGFDGEILGTSGDVVAWVGGDRTLRVANFATCKELHLPLAQVDRVADEGGPIANFSPDGQTIALSVPITNVNAPDSFSLKLIDVKSGNTTDVPLPEPPTGLAGGPAPIGGVAWSPDGQRLFWTYPGSPGTGALIWTWRLGDSASHPVRLTGDALAGPLYTG